MTKWFGYVISFDGMSTLDGDLMPIPVCYETFVCTQLNDFRNCYLTLIVLLAHS